MVFSAIFLFTHVCNTDTSDRSTFPVESTETFRSHSVPGAPLNHVPVSGLSTQMSEPQKRSSDSYQHVSILKYLQNVDLYHHYYYCKTHHFNSTFVQQKSVLRIRANLIKRYRLKMLFRHGLFSPRNPSVSPPKPNFELEQLP